jgi:hypothetical protein
VRALRRPDGRATVQDRLSELRMLQGLLGSLILESRSR